jgi:hypothetical protein
VRGHNRFVLNGHADRDLRAISGFAKHKINGTLGNRRLNRRVFLWLQLPSIEGGSQGRTTFLQIGNDEIG